MDSVRICLNDDTRELAQRLAERYGRGASLSAVFRRAIVLLAHRWERLESMPRARNAELARFAKSLPDSQRGLATPRRPRSGPK